MYYHDTEAFKLTSEYRLVVDRPLVGVVRP